MTSGWFDDGRAFPGGSYGSLGKVKETTINEGPVGDRIIPGKIDGWDEWQQREWLVSLAAATA